MGCPIVDFEIAGKNAKLLSDFYSNVFEWNISPHEKNVYFINTGFDIGINGHIFQTTDEHSFSNHISLYIEVDDIYELVKKTEELGGKIDMTPQPMPDNAGMIAMIIDPSGNRIGLYEPNSERS